MSSVRSGAKCEPGDSTGSESTKSLASARNSVTSLSRPRLASIDTRNPKLGKTFSFVGNHYPCGPRLILSLTGCLDVTRIRPCLAQISSTSFAVVPTKCR
jgi:hypothetical protein